MNITYEKAIKRIAERTADNRDKLKRSTEQRRNNVVDLYGIPFTSQGDRGVPADFYVSVSPDLVYLQRFSFKVGIEPFMSTTVGASTDAVVEVNETDLSVSKNNITPNPHKHTTKAHSHNIVSGAVITHTTASDFRIRMAGIDITPYLMEQQGGEWISGEGIFPNNRLEDEEDLYDILDVASVMSAEGREEDAEKLLKHGLKRIQITSNAPFKATLYVYLKYSNVNR